LRNRERCFQQGKSPQPTLPVIYTAKLDDLTKQSLLPSFVTMVIRNCPVTADDARRALTIYGPDIAALKGKTTKTDMSPRVPTFEAVTLPAHVVEHHRNVTLCVDFFFVQGHCFLHTISRNIGFRTVSPVPDRKILNHTTRRFEPLLKLYESRGLIIRDIHGDNEFEVPA
jgi:hypothetical protein